MRQTNAQGELIILAITRRHSIPYSRVSRPRLGHKPPPPHFRSRSTSCFRPLSVPLSVFFGDSAIAHRQSPIQTSISQARAPFRQLFTQRAWYCWASARKVMSRKDGSVRARDGSVRTRDGSVRTRDASVHARDSSVRTQDGSVRTRDGSVRARDGSVRTQDGSVRTRDGSVRARDSSVCTQDGSVRARDSSVRTQDGSVRARDSSVRTQDGSVRARDGSVRARASWMRGNKMYHLRLLYQSHRMQQYVS